MIGKGDCRAIQYELSNDLNEPELFWIYNFVIIPYIAVQLFCYYIKYLLLGLDNEILGFLEFYHNISLYIKIFIHTKINGFFNLLISQKLAEDKILYLWSWLQALLCSLFKYHAIRLRDGITDQLAESRYKIRILFQLLPSFEMFAEFENLTIQ